MKAARQIFVASLALAACTPAATPPSPAPVREAAAVPSRPIPYPIDVPAAFQRAVERGTRTASGAPGPRYWQQWAHYRIRAAVDPGAKTLTGSETVTYHNRSPDTLAVLYMHLFQNLHAPGSMRNEPAEVTDGIELRRLAVGGQTLAPATRPGLAGYVVDGTILGIRPPRPVMPGDSVQISIDWRFRLPQAGAGARMGYSDDNLLYLGYWYPQMAVYDDVEGWHTDPFLGGAEFYLGFGNYDYSVDAPAGWLVMGTGALQNPSEVLPPGVLTRWRAAMASDTPVTVLNAANFGAGRATLRGRNGRLTWTFRADSVRDVAFSTTRESQWDAARTPVGDRDGDGRPDFATVQALWRQPAPRWRHAVRYAQQSIRHHSEFTGVPYPWPHMTAVEGEDIIGGGMEFPMMTLIGPYTERSDTALYAVIAHELAHMWVPMIVAVDETRYGWFDEGTTDFNENAAFADFFPGTSRNPFVAEQQQYVGAVNRGLDAELLRWTNFHYPGRGGFASYTKPATVLYALRGLLGEETFFRAYRTFLQRWAFRHPYPQDLWNTFEEVSGRELDWFWRTWYAETWTLDQAIGSVAAGPGGTTIVVRDEGRAPMPVRLAITRADGTVERREIPVDVWLRGAREAEITVPGAAARVEIDPESFFPDVDRADNVWPRQ